MLISSSHGNGYYYDLSASSKKGDDGDFMSNRVFSLKNKLALLDEKIAPLVKERIVLVERMTAVKIFWDVKERGSQLMDEVRALRVLPEKTLQDSCTKLSLMNQKLMIHRARADDFHYTHFSAFLTAIGENFPSNLQQFECEPYFDKLETAIMQGVAAAENAALVD